MKTITFNSHRTATPIGWAIRFFSRGKVNHTSIDVGGLIYEAHWLEGVRRVPVDNWDRKETVVETQEIKMTDERYEEVIKWLEKQVGKPYDYMGIKSFLFKAIPQGRNAWFCSEYAYVALAKILGKKFHPPSQRVSPQEFRDILNMVL